MKRGTISSVPIGAAGRQGAACPVTSLAKKLLFSAALILTCLVAIEALCVAFEPRDEIFDRATVYRLPKKRPGAFRIIAYGGSTTWGAPVPELGFVAQLGFFLRELRPDRPLEILNLGRPGSSSDSDVEAVRATIDAQPDLLLLFGSHNEFLDRGLPSRFKTRLRYQLARSGAKRMMVRLAATFRGSSRDRESILPDRLVPYDRNSEVFRAKLERYRDNIDAVLRLASGKKVPILILTPPSNLSGWPPVHRQIGWALGDAAYERKIEAIEQSLASGSLGQAREQLERLRAEHPGDAMGLFLLATLELRTGDTAGARTHFTQARDLDPYPWRALSEMNDYLRLRAALPGVHLIDAERIFADQSPDGITGGFLIADNCHPTPEGSYLIAEAIVRCLSANGQFFESGARLDPQKLGLETFLSHLGESTTNGSLRLRSLLEVGRYSMKTPFFNYEASERVLREAIALDPANWEAWANVATLSLLCGRIEQGRNEFHAALRAKGAMIDLDDRARVPYLREALTTSGVDEAEEIGK